MVNEAKPLRPIVHNLPWTDKNVNDLSILGILICPYWSNWSLSPRGRRWSFRGRVIEMFDKGKPLRHRKFKTPKNYLIFPYWSSKSFSPKWRSRSFRGRGIEIVEKENHYDTRYHKLLIITWSFHIGYISPSLLDEGGGAAEEEGGGGEEGKAGGDWSHPWVHLPPYWSGREQKT